MTHPRRITLLVRKLGPVLTLSAAGLLVACAGNDEPTLPAIDCSTATVQKYSELTIWPICTNCHASTKTGAARNMAPETVNFDSYNSAKASATRAAIRVNIGTMPPAGGTSTPSAEQKAALVNWAQCGTP